MSCGPIQYQVCMRCKSLVLIPGHLNYGQITAPHLFIIYSKSAQQ